MCQESYLLCRSCNSLQLIVKLLLNGKISPNLVAKSMTEVCTFSPISSLSQQEQRKPRLSAPSALPVAISSSSPLKQILVKEAL
ncbi:hypothetical protein VNO80_18652 [Phaseolus coccineus]|uniref:Uncharacterized protein n=1 Tax=Phaseolus coccineus TaxID=3886 RepID=A0AAN9MJR9_PHACN